MKIEGNLLKELFSGDKRERVVTLLVRRRVVGFKSQHRTIPNYFCWLSIRLLLVREEGWPIELREDTWIYGAVKPRVWFPWKEVSGLEYLLDVLLAFVKIEEEKQRNGESVLKDWKLEESGG
jgi:hypothetical protein